MNKQLAKNQAFSIIEMMVALAIVAFLLIGLVQIFSSARASYDIQQATSEVQQNARFIEYFMNKQIAEGGAIRHPELQRALQEASENPTAIIPGAALLPMNLLAPTIDAADTQNDGNGNDSVAVNYYSELDCNDNLTAGQTLELKEVQFRVADNQLLYSCSYAGTNQLTDEIIVDQVETMQLLYGDSFGTDTCPTNPIDNIFLQNRFNAKSTGAVRYVTAGNWCSVESVSSILVGIILNSREMGSLPKDNSTLQLIEPDVDFSATERQQLRKPLVFNINLRNRTF